VGLDTTQRIPLVDAAQLERAQARENPATKQLWDWLDAVKDPEIPVLSIWDLGILRDVRQDGDDVTVVITPTYSGCPAMRVIAQDIASELAARGVMAVRVETRLAPAWTTDWMSEDGRERLRAYGIAPPQGCAAQGDATAVPSCPLCGSANTRQISEFGSTACKALHKCQDCLEPFDYFKCI